MNHLKSRLKYLVLLVLLGHHFVQYGMSGENVIPMDSQLAAADSKVSNQAMQAIQSKNVEGLKGIIGDLKRKDLDRIMNRRFPVVIKIKQEKKKILCSLLGYALLLSFFLYRESKYREIIKILIEMSETLEGAYGLPMSEHTYSPLFVMLRNPTVPKIKQTLIDLELLRILLKNGAIITSGVERKANKIPYLGEGVGYQNSYREGREIISHQKALREEAASAPSLRLLKEAILDDNPYVVYLSLNGKNKLNISPDDLEDIQGQLNGTRSEKVISQYFVRKKRQEEMVLTYGWLTKRVEVPLPPEVVEPIMKSFLPKPSFADSRLMLP